MEVVKQGSSKGVVWLKCQGCQGFLPYMSDNSEDSGDQHQHGPGSELALEDLDIEAAKEYSEDQIYEVGDIIHHRSWNDFGKIISKKTLPGNRRLICVQFLRQGKIQLLEGVA
jgi:hypothetical protein